MDLKHFSHNHPLVFHQIPQGSEIHCSGCKSPGSGIVYVCWHCGHFLHEQCYHAKRSIKHPSHALHPLTLVPYPTYQSGSFICNSCNLEGNGMCYTCSECHFDMHVHCALLPTHNPQANNYCPYPQTPIYSPYANTQNFSPQSHNHTYPPPQNNVYSTNQNDQFPSLYPPPNTPPPNYNPQTGTNGLNSQNNQYPPPYPQPNTPLPNYNPTANTHYPDQTPQPSTNNQPAAPPPFYSTAEPPNTNNPQSIPMIKHFSHPHILKQLEVDQNAGKKCSGCERKLSGSAFCCTEPHCSFKLHKACFDSSLEIRHKSHLSHPLKLVTSPPYNDGFTCKACLKEGKAFAYTCSTCKYDLHISCVSWPEKKNRPDHEHTLTLYYSSPAGQTSQDVTFVCDACRNPIHELAWMYYCRECDFGTHLECISSAAVKPDTAVNTIQSVASAVEEVQAVAAQCMIEALGRQYALALI